MKLSGKRVLVFGAGISGIGAAKLLLDASAEVILYDGNESLNKEELQAKLPCRGRLQIVLGELEDCLLYTSVVLAGNLNRIEIWSKANWIENNAYDDMDDIAEQMTDFGLSI